MPCACVAAIVELCSRGAKAVSPKLAVERTVRSFSNVPNAIAIKCSIDVHKERLNGILFDTRNYFTSRQRNNGEESASVKLNHSVGVQRNSSPLIPFLAFWERNG